jgi:hypothetical protein
LPRIMDRLLHAVDLGLEGEYFIQFAPQVYWSI